jgi:hypothetical protein
MNNLTSRSTDSLLLTTTAPPRGRSRAKPVHLVRQALGIPHFGIAPGAVAPVGKKNVMRQGVGKGKVKESADGGTPLLPILSRLPLEVDTPGFGQTVDENDETFDVARLLPSDSSQSTRVLYTQSRLPYISEQDTHLWRALHHFQPLRQDYASAFRLIPDTVPHPLPTHIIESTCPGFSTRAAAYIPIIRSVFNYSLLPPLPPSHVGKYYGVLFRSTRRPSSSTAPLYAADRHAHEEAIRSGGLLVYWYGVPNPQGDNVATCLWASRSAAREASGLEMHRLAAGLASGVYERYELVRYCVRKEEGETQLRVEVWED